ncbi:DEAD/DEAH box helicase [Desulfoluna spongiiphila]|uniref:DEAD/DEAH box helicase n=1 Tax=Desulfoluna spongiiphila TaxID=419481 RepID=UPI001258E1E2|nr:DEAD/DEAH box helicase [Desulfoluna spongiiphila]VVS93907.1 helicase c-terminal [Desulfoluna spongiiphila]
MTHPPSGLMSAYDRLPPLEKKIVEVLSMAYQRLNQTQLLTCLVALQVTTDDGKAFDTGKKNAMLKMFRPQLDSLLSSGLLEGHSRSVLLVERNVIECITRRLASKKGFAAMAETVQVVLDLTDEGLGGARNVDMDRLVAAMRLFFYRKKVSQATALYDAHIDRVGSGFPQILVWESLCCRPFDPDWFALLPPWVHTDYLAGPLITDQMTWQHNSPHGVYADQLVEEGSDRCEAALQAVVLETWMLTGQGDRLHAWLEAHGEANPQNSLCLKGWMAFEDGQDGEAIALYDAALALLNKGSKSRKKLFFSHFMGIIFILALIREGSSENLDRAKGFLAIGAKSAKRFQEVYGLLGNALDCLTGHAKGIDKITHKIFWDYRLGFPHENLTPFFTFFACYWADKEAAKKELKKIRRLYKIASASPYSWFARELEGLIQCLSGSKEKQKESPKRSGLTELTNDFKVWEHTLKALLQIHGGAPSTAVAEAPEHDRRMAWLFALDHDGEAWLSPREQRLNAKGQWTKGRSVALKRLCEERDSFPYLTAQDKKICSHIYAHYYKDGWYTNVAYVFGGSPLPDAVGHPLLLSEDGVTRVELVEGKPELIVASQGNQGLEVTLSPEPDRLMGETDSHRVVEETPTRFKLISLDTSYRKIAEVLGQGLVVPAAGEATLREVIGSLAGDITIVSDIEGGNGQIAETQADSHLHVQLSPLGHGLKASLAVRPFGEGGPSYAPGRGGKNVIAQVKGLQMATTRDLEQESAEVEALVSASPSLQRAEAELGEWCLPEVEDALDLIQEMEAQGERITLFWPEGKPFTLEGTASLAQSRVSIKKQDDWFSMTGSVVVDEQLTLDMKALLSLFEKSPGRFVEIGKNRFVQLTHEFQKRLRELGRFSEAKGKGVRFHPLAALALEGLIQDTPKVRTDKAWKAHVEKFQQGLETLPPVPSTLDAELREYQVEGYHWMSRLSAWGVGACLADDMGLGKTLQTLAMLVDHAPKGPSLVIAPTSVCQNWLAEARRFAPTLNLIFLAGGNRKKMLQGAGPFDVVVCSYGLMQQKKVAALLADVSWQVAVLDEAQAIKNTATQRSRAAMQIQAAFKLILTGTPIENHLGELWNLFEFINPGLLGSLDRFNKKFAIPIEKNGDRQARKDLKKLIQPFVLRRLKGQVLEELPPRTEIRLDVDLSKEEMAFYEALRRKALERLSSDEESHGGKKHLQILAEITKLRQACCNTQLANKEIALPSSKLAAFTEILYELLQNNHKALVFSQFVGHLSLIRKTLDEAGIPYQYLDGSTPAAQRKTIIEAFQAGQGDVFLISLKAGGVGLNLTAADYVIHMDPWWNPAVEDQASDRAHRIGQTRPVTIYRLVARGTVEEKIVQMHCRKRDLADSLLKGSDVSGKMSAEELLELIRE